ncbi:MAG: CBS domain-containing protein [Anaerolineales bacterium]|nr:CBS domain-containing protein [Anaerolineales bacterium]
MLKCLRDPGRGDHGNQDARTQESDSLAAASERFQRTRHHGLAVTDAQGRLVGVLTVHDLDRVQSDPAAKALKVGDLCVRELLVTYPDESIGAALRRMSTRDVGRMPVVDRRDRTNLLGVLRRTDLVRAYDLALTRRTELRHRAHQVRLGASTGSELTIQEVTIDDGALCDRRKLRDVDWPVTAVIASVRRGHEVIVPRGETLLQAGDVLVVVTDGPIAATLEPFCKRQSPPEK